MLFFGFPHPSSFGVVSPLFQSLFLGSFRFLFSALFLRRLRGGARNGSRPSHFSAVFQCSLNILRESLYYRLVQRLRKLSLLASLLAVIVMKVTRDGDESSASTPIKRRRCDESSASTSIKRRRFSDTLLLLLLFLSFYRIEDIEVFMKKTFNDTIDYETIVQRILRPRFVILPWEGSIVWGTSFG